MAAAASDRLGLAVTIGDVRYPRPGLTLLDRVELADPETGARLARARLVEIDTASGATTVSPAQLEVFAGDWSEWWSLAQRELRRRGGANAKLRIAAGEVTMHMPAGDQTFTDLRCQTESSDAGSQIGFSFRMAGYEMPEPATLSVFRSRQTTPATAGLEIHTGSAALNGGLLAAAWPPAAHLGRDARFCGSLRAVHPASGWEGELAGQLHDVDLDELLTSQFPHKLSGHARIDLEHVRFQADRIEQASGSVVAGPGLAGRSLLKAASEVLGFEPGAEIKTLGRSAPYERLALAFVIDEHGLALRGQCPAGAGVVLQDSEVALMLEPKRASQPVVNLVRALVPQSEVQAPATRESSALSAILPIPSLAPPEADRAEPQARIKLRRPGATLR